MNVSLTRELERLVQRRVASGMYTSASEVMREALRLLEERDRARQARLQQLRKEIDIGLRQLDRGQSRPFDAAGLRRIIKERAAAQNGRALRRKSA